MKNPIQKQFTQDFLDEYTLDCELRKVSGYDESESCTTSPDIPIPPARPFNTDLAEGQIRLLSQTDELTYVALLRRWDEDSFVIAPFSRFSNPATDTELKTEFNGGTCLQVLQIWNIRTAMDATLKKSWLVGNLPTQDCNDAWRVWEWSLGGLELDSRLLERTGVPIYRTDDPRMEYRRKDIEKFARFDMEDLLDLSR